ncbi:heme-dependent oxidative N-demethylase family protein [Ktedonospora formicarum]|uniref:DUF3445 domain-containing protein n=1 Tax=Ktedonospora formicarum TaxID=2778364 RepID=A0A8J3MRW2_9CHLR|nr:DUF3445 domain-containing protein [Ktedonospora formicarum]GHO42695.1 hypothetical protein KSX_08580 [Ktedonospora formicarum]
MIPYFPFTTDAFSMTMGVQALTNNRIVELDPKCYLSEMYLKRSLLETNYTDYASTPIETLASQWEVLQLLLHNLTQNFPHAFTLTKTGNSYRWYNALLQETTTFEIGNDSSLPYAPLDWVGRQVQEDLLLLQADATREFPLIAGQLCFPNAWCLQEKLGKSFLAIHQEVPLFAEKIGRSSQLLLERLKVGRAVWRANWGIKNVSRLNLIPQYYDEVAKAQQELTPDAIGTRCFFRIERQVLLRLPQTGDILFTIHTYQFPLAILTKDIQYTKTLIGVLQTTPPEVLRYKGIAPFAEMLLAYLYTCQ